MCSKLTWQLLKSRYNRAFFRLYLDPFAPILGIFLPVLGLFCAYIRPIRSFGGARARDMAMSRQNLAVQVSFV